MNRRLTISILAAVIAILIAWDIYVAVAERAIPSGQGGTISEVVLAFAKQHPVIPFSLGVVCGHLLWPQRPKEAA